MTREQIDLLFGDSEIFIKKQSNDDNESGIKIQVRFFKKIGGNLTVESKFEKGSKFMFTVIKA